MTRLNSSSPRLKREVSMVPMLPCSSSRPRLVLTASKLMPLASSTTSAKKASLCFSSGSSPWAIILATVACTCPGTPEISTLIPQGLEAFPFCGEISFADAAGMQPMTMAIVSTTVSNHLAFFLIRILLLVFGTATAPCCSAVPSHTQKPQKFMHRKYTIKHHDLQGIP